MDFGHFYYAAKAMTEGHDIYESWEQGYIYPPLLAFLYQPLALFPERVAAFALLCLNIALLSAAGLLAARELSRRFGLDGAVAGIAVLALLLTEDKVRGELQMWQTNSLMLFLFTAALCLLDRWPALAGTALGMAFSIKYLPLVMLPYLLLRRRWVTLGAFIVSAVGFAVLPALSTGWELNVHYLAVAYRGLCGMMGIHSQEPAAHIWNIGNGLSVSITSSFARLLPPGAALAATCAVAIIALFWASRLYRQHQIPFWYRPDGWANNAHEPRTRAVVGLEWVGLVVVALAFSPQTNTRHLCMLLLANTAAALLLFQRAKSSIVPRWPLALGTTVMAAALIFPPPALWPEWHGPWHFIGGPTWGALVLLATLLWYGLRHFQAQWLVSATQEDYLIDQLLTGTIAIPAGTRKPSGIPTFSLILPTYNAGAFIGQTWQAVQTFVQTASEPWEVLFVCDGCTDDTVACLHSCQAAGDCRIRVLDYTPNRGKGFAIRQGLQHTSGAWRLFTDADLAYRFDDVLRLAQTLQSGSDVAIASRVHPASRLAAPRHLRWYAYRRQLQSQVFSWLVQLLLELPQRDTQAGLKGLSARAAEQILPYLQCDGFGFDCELLAICRQQALTVTEVPVTMHLDNAASTTGLLAASRMLRELLSIRRGWVVGQVAARERLLLSQ